VNRVGSSAGEAVLIRLDGVTKGRIGVKEPDIWIGSDDVNLKFQDGAYSCVVPANGDGSDSDNDIDLGYSTRRFKDLYLSGKITNDGTGGINIDGDGRVGIGTGSSISADFHIYQGVDNRVMIESNGPTLTFKEINSTDQNWNIYHNAGDLNFQTLTDAFGSVSTKVLFKNDGKVGIGTNNPVANLHVTDATASDNYPVLRATKTPGAITSNGTNYYHTGWLENRNCDISSGVTDSGYRIGLNIEGYHDSNVFEGTLATYKGIWCRVGNNANGTGTITNNYGIHIETLTGGGMTITNNYGLYQTGSGTTNYFEGNVGIGTTIPGGPLDVTSSRSTAYSETQDQRSLAHIIARNGSDAAGRFASISLVSGGGTQAEGSINLVQTGNYQGDLAFKLRTGANSTDWRERMRITSSGKVGIGESSPLSTLHLDSSNDDIRIINRRSGTQGAQIDMLGYSSSPADGDNLAEINMGGYYVGTASAYFGSIRMNAPNRAGRHGRMDFYTRKDSVFTNKMSIDEDGNVGIGTDSPTYKLEVNGSFAATTKSFDIEHPTKEGMRLHHGSLEGPEHGVYVRGKLTDSHVIVLPDYWTGLVDEDTITVQLTAIGSKQDLWVENIVENTIIVGSESTVNCFYFVQAERKDIDKFDVEYQENN